MPKFTKGQPVTFLQSWDDKGTVCIHELFVYSCGRKQMILVNAEGEKFAGQFFSPDGSDPRRQVHPRLSKADAEAAAIALGNEIIATTRTYCESKLTNPAYHTESVRRDIAALLPDGRAIWGNPAC
jgi:hypothetical protein